MKKALFLCVFALIFSISTTSTLANKATPAFGIKENSEQNFQYETTPGSKIKDSLIAINHDPDRSITLEILTGLPDKWFKIEQSKIELEPNEQKVINYSITIPSQAEIKMHSYVIRSNLVTYSGSAANEGTLSIGLAIGRSLNINVIEGPPETQDFTLNTIVQKSTITPKVVSEEPGQLKDYSNKIYQYVEQNLEFILLLIIIALFLKLALVQRKETTPTKATKKTPAKKAATKRKATTKKKAATKRKATTKKKAATKRKATTKKKAPAKKKSTSKAKTPVKRKK